MLHRRQCSTPTSSGLFFCVRAARFCGNTASSPSKRQVVVVCHLTTSIVSGVNPFVRAIILDKAAEALSGSAPASTTVDENHARLLFRARMPLRAHSTIAGEGYTEVGRNVVRPHVGREKVRSIPSQIARADGLS